MLYHNENQLRGANILKNDQFGRTMIEAIMYLSIIGSLAVATAVLVNKVQDRYKSNKASNQIVDLRKNLNARFAATGDYSEISNITKLVQDKVIPATMGRGSDNTLINAYNGAVTLAAANQGGNNRSYTVTFKDVPKRACIELAILKWFNDDSSDLIRIKIGSKTYEWPYKVTASSDTLPLSTAEALKSCKTEANDITWEFQ